VATTDPVRGRAPTPGSPLPPPVEYYDRGGGIFVRADVTYLRQDFSLPQPVAKPNQWPSSQRFDYMIRIRPLSTLPEAERVQRVAKGREPDYEQRDAVLFALRELTGKDAGRSTDAWYQTVGIPARR
jgi:hypothetical protein